MSLRPSAVTIDNRHSQSYHLDTSLSPPKSANGKTSGFPSKRAFKIALKNASFNLNEDDFEIHSGMSPEPRFVLDPHPRSKRLVFRDMMFEVYNPKIGYVHKTSHNRRLYTVKKDEGPKEQIDRDVSPESKLLHHMLERTPMSNFKFSDRIDFEYEQEGEERVPELTVTVKENSFFLTSPSKVERTQETSKSRINLRENSMMEKSTVSARNSERVVTPLTDKKTPKKVDPHWKLEPIHYPRAEPKKRPNADGNNNNNNNNQITGPMSRRKFSHDVGEKRRVLNVGHIALKDERSFRVDYPEPLLPPQEISFEKSKSSKRNLHMFRQALSKTLFKRQKENSQLSGVVQRLFYNSILAKGMPVE